MIHLNTINQTFDAIGKAPFASLSLPYVSYRHSIGGELGQYSMREVFTDYGDETAAHNAFVAMLEQSTCPMVQVYKETVKACFVWHNLDQLETFSGEV